MKDGKLGVAILGCGMMGNIHADGWARLSEVRLLACADILEDRAQALAEKHGLEAWSGNYRQAVLHPGVDVVSICTPTHLHAEMAVFAANQGKHVLTEKPIARTLQQVQLMQQAAQANHIKLGVGFMRRQSPVFEALRQALKAGQLGRPVLYTARDLRQVRPKLAMHDDQQNGGPVIDMAVHYIDVWNAIFDSRPAQVFARGLTLAAGRPELTSIAQKAPDTAELIVQYESGDLGSFTVTWGLPPAVNPPPMPDLIFGPLGMYEVIIERTFQGLRWLQEGGEWRNLASGESDLYFDEIAAMKRWILEGQPYPATAEAGELALRVALAARESMRSGKPIDL